MVRATKTVAATPNKVLQMDKDKLSYLLHTQKPRQFAFAADRER